MASPFNDPYVTYRFKVEFSASANGTEKNLATMGFQSVSGLSLNVQTMDYREGDERATIVRKLPGLTKIGNVTLKRGLTSDGENSVKLFEWLGGVASLSENGPTGGLNLMDITITLADSQGGFTNTPSWRLGRCYPISFSVPDLNASSNTLAITSMEFAVSTFRFDPPNAQYSEIQTTGDSGQA